MGALTGNQGQAKIQWVCGYLFTALISVGGCRCREMLIDDTSIWSYDDIGGLAGGRHTSDIGFSSVTCDMGIS